MDGSLSFDPEVTHVDQSGMNFTWQYGEVKGNYFRLNLWKGERVVFPGVDKSTVHYFGKAHGDQISLNTNNMSANKTYIIRLVVTKENRSSTAHQVIHLVEGNPPILNQR